MANGFSQKRIAQSIRVSPSTVCREIKRNFSKRKYSASGAQEWADVRMELRAEHLSRNRAIKPPIKNKILTLLKQEQWSPKQINGYLAKKGISVSHTTIYNWIWEDKKQGGGVI